MNSELRKALFVVYEFPPEGSRGTKRSIKFIRYLPSMGWSAVVLTVQNSPNRSFDDPSLFSELPTALPIYRARTLESFFHGESSKSTATVSPSPRRANHPNLFRKGFLALYHFLGKFTKIPDSRILWAPFAVIKGLRAIGEQRCEVIYSSGPTHTNHFVGALLARLKRLPHVMDFRDAWVGDSLRRKNSPWIQRGEAWMERFCVKSARVIVCTTDGMKSDFERRYPRLRARCVTITNGFDPADFDYGGSRAGSLDSRLLIIHTGTLGEERTPVEFLEAVGELIRECPEVSDRLEIIFVGKNSKFNDGCTIEEYIDRFQCKKVVKLAGYVSRKESLDYMKRADVLLLIIGKVPVDGAFVYGISGKLYDYAAAEKPVLTIAEVGSTSELAKRMNLGPIVDPGRISEIKKAIFSLLEQKRMGNVVYAPNREVIRSFEFSDLTRRLAGCFDAVVKH